MDLYIDRNELIRGLGRVQGVVERRTTNVALANVLLSARNDRLRMTATDSAIALVADYPARVEKEGELSVDAATFFQIARSLSDATVHLSTTAGNRLRIQCGTADFNVVGLSAEDFPPAPTRDDQATLKVAASDLRRIIGETIFSVSADDNRYGLNGAHIEEITTEGGEARVRMVTTDGSRLSWSECVYEGEFGMGRRMLLPRKALAEVRKLADAGEGAWEISFGERSATFSTEGMSLMALLVDGDFPDYRQVLPDAHKRRITVSRAGFVEALRHVAIMASDRNHSVRFAFEADQVVLTARNVDTGDVREELAAQLEGEPLFTGFNVRYFQDILAATSSESLLLELGEPLDPCIVRMPDQDGALFVVMPMRLD